MGLLDQASSFATTLAEQQSGLNMDIAQQEALLNRVNQISPYGNVTYSQGPTGQFTQTTTLSPEQQAQFDLQQGMGTGLLSQAQQQFGQPISYEGATGLPELGLAERDAIANKIYQGQVGKVDQAYDRAFENMQQSMADRSIGYGNYGNVQRTMGDFADTWGNTYNDLLANAYTQAGQDQAIMYDQAMQGRQQDISEIESKYYSPLNAYNALMGGNTSVAAQGLASNPSAINLDPTDITGTASNFFSTLQSGENAAKSAGASALAAQLGYEANMASLAQGQSQFEQSRADEIALAQLLNPDLDFSSLSY